jgi:hypothetical protein
MSESTAAATEDRLAALHRGFRAAYLDYLGVTEQLHAWAAAFPEICHLSSLGRTPEGRELWLLTLGPEPERRRPAVWVDGNMHASELCGCSVALGIAEDVLRLHVSPEAPLHGLPEHLRDTLRKVLFYVLPRMSPDGAEAVIRTGRWVRSVPRDRRPDRARPRWVAGDVDGDGQALLMRQRDPAGEFVEATEAPGLMLPRELEDAGPAYKLYPEGQIEPFDGHSVPDPHYLADNDPDLNRNFPWSWAPEPEQVGAGPYPGSEPESAAVVAFTSAHQNLFAWLNLHTFGGVFIRPLGQQPDNKMEPEDLAVFREIAEWNERLTGYPTVSGFEEFTYAPDTPLRGDMSDYAYHQRGCIAYVCELWDLFRELGMTRPRRFVDYYRQVGRAELLRLARWDAEHNGGRLFPVWRAVEHPQLGAVEVGGMDPRVGIWNPPYDRVAGICAGQAAAFLRVAALLPQVAFDQPRVEALGGELSQVRLTVRNLGYLATYGLPSARALAWNEPLHVLVEADGCELVEPASGRTEIGHLTGWGRGRQGAGSSAQSPRSRGSSGRRLLSWTVRGRGRLRVRAGCCRVGWVEQDVQL